MRKDLKIIVSEDDLLLDACSFYLRFEKGLYNAFNWMEPTRDAYGNYIRQLAPHLKDRTLLESNADIFSEAIELLNQKRRRKYSAATLKTIQSVINDICYFAEVYSDGKYSNAIWGTTWHSEDTSRSSKSIDNIIEKKLATPKSLSLLEEIKLLNIVRRDHTADSFAVGLAIMFYMGLRPGECAGLKYGDIRPLRGHHEVNCLYVHSQIRSTKEKTSSLKTENAYRVLPIPRELDVMLQDRIKEVKERCESITDLPIVCKSEVELHIPCNPNIFAEYCKMNLREVSVKEATVCEAAEASKAEGMGEAAATSYLLRRNFATALLAVCGLDADEIKYLMGHAIYTTDEKRRDYLNPDVLFRLWEKENIRSFFSETPTHYVLDDKALTIHQKQAIITVPNTYFERHPAGTILNVHNVDANDRVKIIVKSGEPQSITMVSFNQPVPQKRAERVRVESEFSEAVTKKRNKSKSISE